MEKEVIATCAVWGDWPGSRIGHTEQHNNRGGDANMQGEYIKRLANSVSRNLTVPHRFICFADDTSKVPKGIEARKLDVPWICRGLPKAYIYGAPFTGCDIPEGTRILVFDLDMVITGNLDNLVSHGRQLVVRERGYRLPNYVPDGDLVFSLAGSDKAKRCAEYYFQEIKNKGAKTNKGDEREILGWAGARCWGKICPGQVVSYKRHCRNGLPENARVVSFHGKPLQSQVGDDWVKEHWR